MSAHSKHDPDVFISYSHLDNKNGWIDEFHLQLERWLGQFLAKPANIWRDIRIDSSTGLSNEILDHLRRSAVLVPILTPSWVISPWCLQELKEFQSAAAQNGGLWIGNRIRIIPVVKTPLDRDRHRDVLSMFSALPHDFYELRMNSHSREFRPDTSKFEDNVESLAQEIVQTLQSISDRDGTPQSKVAEGQVAPPGGIGSALARVSHPVRNSDQMQAQVQITGSSAEQPSWNPAPPSMTSIPVLQSTIGAPVVLYSVNSWLAYKISERYYSGEHHVRCAPLLGNVKRETSIEDPVIDSSPFEIYKALLRESKEGDHFSPAIWDEKTHIVMWAASKQKANEISKENEREIYEIVQSAKISDFRPVLYVIPYQFVAEQVKVPASLPGRSIERALLLSDVLLIEKLHRRCFHVIEYLERFGWTHA